VEYLKEIKDVDRKESDQAIVECEILLKLLRNLILYSA
jgi:hypothetical protein